MEAIQNFDVSLLTWLNNFFSAHGGIINKIFAEYFIYLLPVILIIVWFKLNDKKPALRALFSVILAWPIIAAIIGKLVNRPRPFEVENVTELVFHRPTYSFPSDHAAALFAVAMSFYFSGYKKLSYWMLVFAFVISFFRVSTAIHWPTDIFGGIIVGVISAYIIKLLDKKLEKVYDWIINLAKKVGLA